jgi:hypothetical protein
MKLKTVLVHFDVSEEYVLLETFVASAQATKKTVDAINKAYFDGRLIFEVVILPPAPGSLKQYIGVVFKVVGGGIVTLAALLAILDSETVQDISKEFMGAKPSELIIQRTKIFQENLSNLTEDELGQQEVLDTLNDNALKYEGASIIEELITRSATGALEMQRNELNKTKLPDEIKFNIAEAQSELFGQALHDQNVRGIGFTEEEDFPVPRSSFAERAVRPTSRNEPDLEEDWVVTIQEIHVTSPNFDREDQGSRKWKGKLASGAQLLFEVLDEEFWLRLKKSEVKFNEATVITAQMASRMEKSRRKENKLIRLLSIDDTVLASPLSDEALAAALGSFKHSTNKSETPDLFN